MTERIEAQIERFAPGFRDLILGRSTFTAVDEEEHNPSYVGGRHQCGRGHPPPNGVPADHAVEPVPHRAQAASTSAPPPPHRVGASTACAGSVRRAPPCTTSAGTEPARRSLMRARAMSFAGYRFRTTLRSELSYYVSVILLVGALGGLSMGAVAAARSTESSFSDYVASSHVPDLFVLDGVINPAIGLDSAYNPALLRKLSHLPHVERVVSTLELNMGPLTPKGRPLPASASIPADASVKGLYFTEDPVAITQGQMLDPHKADEVRARCGHCEGIRVSRGGGDSRRVAHQCAGELGEPRAELNHPEGRTGAGEACRHRGGAGDEPVPGPGRGQQRVHHVVHAGTDRQAARRAAATSC